MKMFSYLFLLLAVVYVCACSTEDPATSSTKDSGKLGALVESSRSTNVLSRVGEPTKLRLKKVQYSVINNVSLNTIKLRRPNLYKLLSVEGNVIKSNSKVTLYKGGSITVILGNNDMEESPDETDMIISGYEKIPIDIIGDLILWAICQCESGSDDCKFDRNPDGTLGECMGSGACSDCRGGFEISGPEGDIAQVEASF